MGKNARYVGSFRMLLRGLLLWGLCALLLLTLSSLILTKAKAGSDMLGYCSSAISFLSAGAAAFFVSDRKRDKPLLQGLLLAFFLVVVLLTLGFLARGKGMDPSGILSVGCFTFAGALLGSVLSPRGRGRRRPKGKSFRRTG